MAEGGAPIVSNRNLIIVISVVLVVIVAFFIWTFAGCSSMSSSQDSGYTTIYTNLELKDSANVVARLKDLKIPYKLKTGGSAVAVPKDKTDEARLGLAEKNLPQGGSVGWELFNENRMGATDFDRRIQLIRAISGELERTIRRIEGVDDVKVQIVLPETRLFEVNKAPVTASVFLKVSIGKVLKPEHVNGIIHLVASSVENLKPENVTVVDYFGNILSANEAVKQEGMLNDSGRTKIEPVAPQEAFNKPASPEVKQSILSPEANIATVLPPQAKPLGAEEKALLKLKAKDEYERQLSSKAQDLLGQFYPRNSLMVRVNVAFGEPKSGNLAPKFKIHSKSHSMVTHVVNAKAIVLLDNKIELTHKLKKVTYQTVAFVMGYNKKRGDKIIIRQVPFHYTGSILPKEPTPHEPKKSKSGGFNWYLLVGIILAVSVAGVLIIRFITQPKQKSSFAPEESTINANAPSESEASSTIKQIKDIAENNPERIASLLKKWLTEEE